MKTLHEKTACEFQELCEKFGESQVSNAIALLIVNQKSINQDSIIDMLVKIELKEIDRKEIS